MQGKRIEKWDGSLLKEGEYAKSPDGVWYCSAPGCHMGNLKSHTVTEHDDGTITVSPSILITQVRGDTGERKELFHGYLERGIWRSCYVNARRTR
jgi:hypothetical protein